MERNATPPDYELADRIALTEPSQVKALSHPLRTAILGLLHERAATVNELATALGRPKSTVAHHVGVLVGARLLRVVRTRRVRAIEERFYGRTARLFYVSVDRTAAGDDMPRDFNDFEVAARESAAAYEQGKLWGFIRHARISEAQASAFWERMAELVEHFDGSYELIDFARFVRDFPLETDEDIAELAPPDDKEELLFFPASGSA